MNFLNVFYASELDSLESDGLLGMSPKPNRLGSSGQEMHLLVDQLKMDKIIDKAIFSILLGLTS